MQGPGRELTRRIQLLSAPVAVLAVALASTLLGAPPALAAAQEPEPPARAWILVDAGDGERLAARAPGRPAAVASATKLMTAYVARRDLRLSERVVAPPYPASPAESLLGLQAGERIRVRDLLAGLLLASGNDAAEALARASAGSVGEFVEEMNRTARDLGLNGTRFSNPVGLDEPGNRSTPQDLASLVTELRRDPYFRRLFSRPQARLRSGTSVRRVVNRNELVRAVPWIDGVKTGRTADAGFVLVGSGTRNGVTLVSVVLGAPSEDARDAATLELLRYGFSLYGRQRAVAEGEPVAGAQVRHRDETLPLIATRSLDVFVREDQEIATQVIASAHVEGPIERGERLGRVLVSVDGEPAGQARLVAARSVSAATSLERLDYVLPGPRFVLWVLGTVMLAGLLAGGLLVVRRLGGRGDNLSDGESS